MKLAAVAAAALLAAALAAGCAGTPDQTGGRGAGRGPEDRLGEWLALLGHPPLVRAPSKTAALRRSAMRPNANVEIVHAYKLVSGSQSERYAVALVTESSDPAQYLHSISTLIATTRHPDYIQVLDSHHRTVFEWYSTPGRNSLYVRPDLEGCTPARAIGWSTIPPCPGQ